LLRFLKNDKIDNSDKVPPKIERSCEKHDFDYIDTEIIVLNGVKASKVKQMRVLKNQKHVHSVPVDIDQKRLDEIETADTDFLVYNTCKQLQENVRLTALEADESIHDVHLARQEFVNEKRKVMKMHRAIMNLYKDNKALQKSNDGLELEVRSCKKEKIAILSGIRGYLNSIRRNEEAKRSHEYHNGPLSDNLDEIKENESISTSHTLDESINSQLTSFESVSSIEAPTAPSSTCSSLITDDEYATLRLAKRNGKPSTFPFLRGAIQEATTNSCEVEFTSNPGLQFLRLPPNVIVDANVNPHLPVFLI
jgi:hypothetical protein